MKNTLQNTVQRGFTLIEAIMVIVITGILGTMVAVFIRAPVDGYLDSVARAELTDAGDTALRRMARDVRTALPNSLRTAGGTGTSCFEFLPTVGGGRYRIAQSSTATGDVLDFSVADTSFDVLASTNLPPPGGYATPHHVVIYNLGIPGADAYTAANLNRAAIAAASTAANITLPAAGNKFPFQSPGKRFQVISNFSVIYSCSARTLIRSTRAITAAPLATCPAVGTVLVGNVDCANTSFTYNPAVSQRNGLLTMTLVLTQAGASTPETIRLYQEVHVDNTP